MATGRKAAAWLALVSLLLQLCITAGHFHPEDFAGLPDAAHAGAALAASTDHGRQAPSAILHEDCALCLSVQIASSAALTAAAFFIEPAVRDAVALGNIAALPRGLPAHLLFQTRAPPTA